MNNKNIRAMWIELIGFDNRQIDMGVSALITKAGFTPSTLVLLVWSSDFVHHYSSAAPDDTLLGWDCSAYGCRRQGLEHDIQQWTKGQVKDLIANLKARQIDVYLSFFDQIPSEGHIKRFQIPEMPKLWVNEHQELFFTTEKGEIEPNICPWKRLSDGTFYEDFLIKQLISCLKEFGFSGLHGADGYAHQRLPISRGDFSDDMVEQSGISSEKNCDGSPKKLKARAEDILLHHKKEWTAFYRRRYAAFWKHVSDELQKNNQKLIMNSFWARDPFEALFRYGEDYSLLTELHLEALVLEAPISDELTMWHSKDVRSIYKYFASLLRIRSILPDVPIWHMNGLRDVLEDYNVVQQFPALLEAGTEFLQHALLFHNGQWTYALNGLLSCLSDGITKDNWNWVRSMWDYTLTKSPVRSQPGATVVYSQSMLDRELDAYLEKRFASSFRLHWLLLGAGAPLYSIIPVKEVNDLPAETPLVVLNSRFLSYEEKSLLEKRGGTILYLDGEARSNPELNDPPFFTGDLQEPNPSSETIQQWARQICSMTPDAPEVVEDGYHAVEETLENGVKLITVFNDMLYCRYVTIKVSAAFSKIQPIFNHLIPPYATPDTFTIHLPPFGFVAVKLFP